MRKTWFAVDPPEVFAWRWALALALIACLAVACARPDDASLEPCEDSRTCLDDQICRDGACVAAEACEDDAECGDPADFACLNGICVERTPADVDDDDVPDALDNCPEIANPDQADADDNGTGDACEADADSDGVPDPLDNCPGIANRNQEDLDGNGVGDVCELDTDGDGVLDYDDNCPETPNADQADADEDGIGDACRANLCARDAECPADKWCRPTQDPMFSLCVDFRMGGEACGGTVSAWEEARCSDALICTEIPLGSPDAPGVCRRPCQGDDDCTSAQYCASHGACLVIGDCTKSFDCNLDGNTYYQDEECPGYGQCDESVGRCQWQCGVEPCRDLAGLDLGMCARRLGYGVVGDDCEVQNGCGLDDQPFFATIQECRARCGFVQTCEEDDDCLDEDWCRPRRDDVGDECVRYAGEGEACGGDVPDWSEDRCGPGLECTDFPPAVSGAPGICRRTCEEGGESCTVDQYCGVNGFCRDHGSCWEHLDCDLPRNAYDHIECGGYGVCSLGECYWQCGLSQCRDYSNVFFGQCEAEIGFGVVGDACVALSGCDDGGYPIFSSAGACRTDCGITSACSGEEECADGLWCRATDDPMLKECIPRVAEGGACNPEGAVDPQLEARCETTLACDTPAGDGETPDVGTCQTACDTGTPCPTESFCSDHNGVCRAIGACATDADCANADNTYEREDCPGAATCAEDGACVFTCTPTECLPRDAITFGDCGLSLGWVVFEGSCQEAMGCEAEAPEGLFADEGECVAMCL